MDVKGEILILEEGKMTEPTAVDSVRTINQLVRICHETSLAAGWWHDPETGEDLRTSPYVMATKMLLVISEIIEGVEGHRRGGLNDDKLVDRSMLEVELADAVIRIFDLAGVNNFDLGKTIMEKLNFNSSRPDHKISNRRKVGGKLY